jgi:hypothetical protein
MRCWACWLAGWVGLSQATLLPAQDSPPERSLILQSQTATAVLQRIQSDLQLEFRIAEKTLIARPAELIRYGAWRLAKSGPLILLTDGSVLRADLLEVTSEHLKLGDATGLGRVLWSEATLPLTQVRAICFDPPASELARDQLLTQLASGQSRDRVWLANGETIAGLFVGLDMASEENGQRAAALRLQPGDTKGPLSVPLAKVTAVSLNATLSKPPQRKGARLAIGFRDGSLLFVRSVEGEGAKVRFQLVCGATLMAMLASVNGEPREFWEQVELVQSFGGCAIYLSDEKPVSFKAVPFLTVDWPYKLDQSVLGGRLRKSGGEVALKGLGLHTAGRLIYEVPEKAERFEAELAIDARAGDRGSAQFRVLMQEENGEWASHYESPIVRGGEAPVPISLALKNAQRIALLVDFADRGDECDYANWLDARFVLAP